MKRWMITGAGGFLGSRLAGFYRDQYEITGVKHEDLDITDVDSVRRFVSNAHPDAVIHCAAISNTGTCEKEPQLSRCVNVEGTVNLAKACGEAGSRLIVMSSDQIYAGNKSMRAAREDEAPEPVNVYGRHKRQAEEMAMAECPETVCLRLPWLYDFPARGMKSNSNLLGNLLKALIQDQPVKLPVHDYRGITWVYAVVKNMETALGLPGGVYNFGGGNSLSTYETALQALDYLLCDSGRKSLLVPDQGRFAEQPRNLRMDISKIREYGIDFPDAVEGFQQCFEESAVYLEGMIR